MAIYDDLQWLEAELLEDGEIEEPEEEEEDEEAEEESFRPLVRRRSRPVQKAVYADERDLGDSDALFVEKKKKRKAKGIRRLKFLAFLEILAILAVLWWWIKWLY